MAAELWSRTEERRLTELWDKGLALSEIAESIGRSRSAVNARLRRMGIRRDPAASRRPKIIRAGTGRINWTQEMDRKMLDLRAKGKSMAAIAVEMGRCEQVVRKRLHELDPHPIKEWRGPDSSLCWYCARSVGTDRCSWAARFEPVPGWDARRRDKDSGESYFVRNCPQFKEG